MLTRIRRARANSARRRLQWRKMRRHIMNVAAFRNAIAEQQTIDPKREAEVFPARTVVAGMTRFG